MQAARTTLDALGRCDRAHHLNYLGAAFPEVVYRGGRSIAGRESRRENDGEPLAGLSATAPAIDTGDARGGREIQHAFER